ncbi:MAG: glycerophosphodiester phosphodiesterase [Acidimicrobiia bacterium]|nr:glycerophosphodiester phosphodiesterase [Acidimicrobiia bacterium]
MLRPQLLFAHRGARAHEQENTLPAFALALKLGATGLESDVWLTRDGVAVLDHDGVIGSRLRRRSIKDADSADLPAHIPTLEQLLDLAERHDVAVSLDVKDRDAFPVVRAMLTTRPRLSARTYLCCEDFDVLRDVAPQFRDVRLVDSSRLAKMKDGPERRLAQLADLGVVALNMHHSDWNGGLVTLAHRFERLAFAWDAQFDHTLTELLRMGVDAVFSDWVDRMVDAAREP